MRTLHWMPALALLLALATLAVPTATVAAQEQPGSDPAAELYRSARLLEAEGERDLADALMDYILRRYPESAAAAEIRRVRAAPGSRQGDEDGSTELVVWSTLYGLWLGVAVPAMLGAEGTEPYGLGLLIGGPAGFAAGRAATRNVSVTEGQAAAITWAGGWGTWQGFGWAHVLDPGQECRTEYEPVYCPDEPGTQALFGWMIAGGLLGTAGGALASRRLEISPGDAALVNLGSLWGTWYGLALGVIADVEDDGLLAATLIGGNLGAGAGAALARAYPISRTQARIASIIGVVGGLAGAGVDLILQPDDAKVAMAIPALTSAVALGLGASRIQLRPESDGAGEASPGGAEWRLGGGVVPTAVRGSSGEYRTAVKLTLLNASF